MSDYSTERGTVEPDPADQAKEAADKAREGAHDVADEAGRAADRTKEDAKSVGHSISDAIDDVIPGDSDGDGH